LPADDGYCLSFAIEGFALANADQPLFSCRRAG
jgi:hypothetical protein